MAVPVQLESGEQVVIESKRHWINVMPVWIAGAVLVLAAVALSYISGRLSDTLNRYLPVGFSTILLLVLVGLAVLIVWIGMWVYHQNRLLLTNRHLIKVEQNGLFVRKVSQLSLSRVQDVNGARHGLLATILNFGTVEVQSAGEQEEFIFIQMPRPADLAAELMKAHDQFVPESDGTRTP